MTSSSSMFCFGIQVVLFPLETVGQCPAQSLPFPDHSGTSANTFYLLKLFSIVLFIYLIILLFFMKYLFLLFSYYFIICIIFHDTVLDNEN